MVADLSCQKHKYVCAISTTNVAVYIKSMPNIFLKIDNGCKHVCEITYNKDTSYRTKVFLELNEINATFQIDRFKTVMVVIWQFGFDQKLWI